MKLFKNYLEKRHELKELLDAKRKTDEDLYWKAYKDADSDFVSIIEKFLCLIAIAKFKLALICPVEARAIYALIFVALKKDVDDVCSKVKSVIPSSNETLTSEKKATERREFIEKVIMPEKSEISLTDAVNWFDELCGRPIKKTTNIKPPAKEIGDDPLSYLSIP